MSEVFRTRSSRSDAFCKACAPFIIAFDVVRTAFVCHSVWRSVPSMWILWATSKSRQSRTSSVIISSKNLNSSDLIWTTYLRENWESGGNMDPIMRHPLVLTSCRASLEWPLDHVYPCKLSTDALATDIHILLCWNDIGIIRMKLVEFCWKYVSCRDRTMVALLASIFCEDLYFARVFASWSHSIWMLAF